MEDALIVPGAEPFFFPGGPVGCLLLHGFTAMPEEMRWLGEALAGHGHTVFGVRLAGHATSPADLARTRWTDWLISVEEGLAFLAGVTDQVFLVGQSMGGMIALVAAAALPCGRRDCPLDAVGHGREGAAAPCPSLLPPAADDP